MAILLIHPRRGLFQITKCKECGYIFECNNCTAKLTTYKATNKLELVCHQCQSSYDYPNQCPNCKSRNIISLFGGIEDLEAKLKSSQKEVIRLDLIKDYTKTQNTFRPVNCDSIFLTTRVYDPAINYDFFDKIIFVKAENLLASPDYLVREEVLKQITELFLKVDPRSEIIFDTASVETEFFQDLIKLNQNRQTNLKDWFLDNLKNESETRQKLGFPPHQNLILITTQEKTIAQSLHKINSIKEKLEKQNFQNLRTKKPYPARFLKRKNMYSHHLLIKVPRNYKYYLKLQKFIKETTQNLAVQVRLNPKNLF